MCDSRPSSSRRATVVCAKSTSPFTPHSRSISESAPTILANDDATTHVNSVPILLAQCRFPGLATELSMGPLCVTRSNPTHQLTDRTQPTTSEKFGPNPTHRPNPLQLTNLTAGCNQILSNRALNALTQSFRISVLLLYIVDPTQPNPPKTDKSRPSPAEPNTLVNPTRGQLWLAISNTEILIYFSSKIHENNFIKQYSETVAV